MGELDTVTFPSESMDDPSVRNRYYNFWQLVRLSFYASIGTSIASDFFCSDDLDCLENEMEDLIHFYGRGEINVSMTRDLSGAFMQNLASEIPHGLCSAHHDELPSFLSRIMYWISVCRIISEIDALLYEDFIQIQPGASNSGIAKASVELSVLLDWQQEVVGSERLCCTNRVTDGCPLSLDRLIPRLQ